MRAAGQRALVGREREVEASKAALDDTRRPFALLFVTGSGGIGKTSLLRRFAHEAHEFRRTVVELDGRAGQSAKGAFETNALRILTREGAVLIVDGFEDCQGIESCSAVRVVRLFGTLGAVVTVVMALTFSRLAGRGVRMLLPVAFGLGRSTRSPSNKAGAELGCGRPSRRIRGPGSGDCRDLHRDDGGYVCRHPPEGPR